VAGVIEAIVFAVDDGLKNIKQTVVTITEGESPTIDALLGGFTLRDAVSFQ
jgi:hypothetical protein